MNEDVIRASLAEFNPFVSCSAADPWDNKEPDVTSMNGETFKHLCNMITARAADPSSPIAGVVLGGPGSGKTHLLRRLLSWARANDSTTIFVSVRPFLNPKRRLQHLLNEIATSFARIEEVRETTHGMEKKKKVNQFEFFVTRVLAKYLKEKSLNESSLGLSEAEQVIRKKFPGISRNLLKAVFDYRDESKQILILEWLRGGVNEEFQSVLGFPDRETMDVYDLEEDASAIIRSLGMLLKHCGMSMVVCFDQFEGIVNDPQLVSAFSYVVHFLVNEVSAMLPLVFARWEIWEEKMETGLDSAVRSRLQNKLRLDTCSQAQALELVRARIRSRFSEADEEEKYRWLVERLQPKLQGEYSPRRVIELANREILNPSETVAVETLPVAVAHEYRRERERVAADFDLWPPDTDRLRRVLEIFLSHRSEFSEIRFADEKDKYISLKGTRTPADPGEKGDECAFIINTAEHFKTVEAALKRGISLLENGGRCWYITDGRCKFCPTTWKKANEALKSFRNSGGVTLVLDRERAVDWYGLMALVFKLKAGDIQISTADGHFTATEEDLSAFMREGFEKDLLRVPVSVEPTSTVHAVGKKKEKTEKPTAGKEGVKATKRVVTTLPADTIPLEREEYLENKILAFLKKSPMGGLAAGLLQEQLTVSGESVGYELLLEFVNKRPNSFYLFPTAEGGSFVQLAP